MTTTNDKMLFLSLYDELLRTHDELSDTMLGSQAYTADVSEVALEDEDKMAKGELSLGISHYDNAGATAAALRAWRHYKVADNCSTKYVKRYAGFVTVQDQNVLTIVKRINALKDQLKVCVQDAHIKKVIVIEDGKEIEKETTVHGRSSAYQKHQFIHEVAPRIMTLQLYRHIPVFEKPVDSISFYWANKSVPRRMNKLAAIDYIKRKYDTALHKDELLVKVADIENSVYEDFEIQKVQNAALMASLYDGRKTHNMHSTTPMILTQPSSTLQFNRVPNYKLKEPNAEPKIKRGYTILCRRTHLYGVERLMDIK